MLAEVIPEKTKVATKYGMKTLYLFNNRKRELVLFFKFWTASRFILKPLHLDCSLSIFMCDSDLELIISLSHSHSRERII